MDVITPPTPGHEDTWDIVDATADVPTQDTASETPDEATTHETIVAALRTETDVVAKRAAAATIFRRAYYNAERGPLRDCGAVAALVAVIETSDDFYCKLYALDTLRFLVAPEEFESIRNVRGATSDEWTQLQGAVSDSTRPESERIEALEIVHCLQSVTADDDENSKTVVPKIVALLPNTHAWLSSTAAQTLCRLAQLGHVSQISAEEATPLLIELLRNGAIHRRERAADTLSSLVKHHDVVASTAVSAGALELLVGLLQTVDGEQRLSAALAIAAIVEDNEERQRAAVDAGALAPLFQVLQSRTEDEQAAAIQAIGELMGAEAPTAEFVALQMDALSQTGGVAQLFILSSALAAIDELDDQATKALYIKCGIVGQLVNLLAADLPDAQAKAAAALEQLVNKQDAIKQQVLDAGGIPLLVAMLRLDSGYNIKPFVMMAEKAKMAAPLGALCTLAHANGLCKLRIAQAGALPEFVRIIRESDDNNEKTLAATAVAELTAKNDAYAIEAALLGVLEPLIAFARESAEREDANGVVGALSALCMLSVSKHNQDEILGLGIRGLLQDTENTTPTTQNIANTIRSLLGLKTQQPDACSIL